MLFNKLTVVFSDCCTTNGSLSVRVTTVLWMTTVAPPTRAGATLPSPAGKVDRRIAETDEEVTYLQIPMLLKTFSEELDSLKK